MYVSFILYTLATVFVLAACQEFHHEKPVHHHPYTDVSSCQAVDIIANRRKASLRPRERHVVLKPKPGFEFFPRTVSVKRCNGQCPGPLTPMPTRTTTRSFTVHLHREGQAVPLKCVSVQVPEHKACKCECMRTERSCNGKQMWDQSNCACPCIFQNLLKSNCEAKRGNVWHDTHCECQCSDQREVCASGLIWNEILCDCVSDVQSHGW